MNPKHGQTKLGIAERTGAYGSGVTVVSVLGGGALAFACILVGEMAQVSPTSAAGAALWTAMGLSLPGAIVGGRLYLRRFLKKRRKALEELLSRLAHTSREVIDDNPTD